MFNFKHILVLSLMGAIIVLGGCKATPAPDSGYLQNSQNLTAIKRVPFDRSYWGPDLDLSAYDELYVAPVNTAHLMKLNTWESVNLLHLSPRIKADVARVARYTQEAFVTAAEKDPKKHFRIVTNPGPKTLVLEIAIVQLVPSKVELNVLSFIFWEATVTKFVGPAIMGSEDASKGIIAIEARLRNGQTGEVVAMFADRERPKEAVLNLQGLLWWAPVHAVIDDWSRQFVAVCNAPRDQVVKASRHWEILALPEDVTLPAN